MKLKIRSPQEWLEEIKSCKKPEEAIKALKHNAYFWQYMHKYSNIDDLQRVVLNLDYQSCLKGIKLFKKEQKNTQL